LLAALLLAGVAAVGLVILHEGGSDSSGGPESAGERELSQYFEEVKEGEHSGIVGEPIVFPSEPNQSESLSPVQLDGGLWVLTMLKDGTVRRVDPPGEKKPIRSSSERSVLVPPSTQPTDTFG